MTFGSVGFFEVACFSYPHLGQVSRICTVLPEPFWTGASRIPHFGQNSILSSHVRSWVGNLSMITFKLFHSVYVLVLDRLETIICATLRASGILLLVQLIDTTFLASSWDTSYRYIEVGGNRVFSCVIPLAFRIASILFSHPGRFILRERQRL